MQKHMNKKVMRYVGADLLKDIKRLKDVKRMKDVNNLTHTLFPGPRCPMIGAIMTTRGFKDSFAVIVGTDECSYYAKRLTQVFEGFGGIDGRCVSVRLDTNDVTFGSVEKVEEAFVEIMDEYKPSCIFLVSTCLIEIIGDDFDALAASLTKTYGIPILPVHTEHFKCEDQLPGVERALAACIDLMKKEECNHTVNIMGQRHGNFKKSELALVLKEAEIEINLEMPNICYLDDVKRAPKAALNIVVGSTALDLAKKMQERFGIPYVIFYRSASHETVYNAYKDIFSILQKPVPQSVHDAYAKCKQIFEERRNRFTNMKYVYGGAPFASFEHMHILTDLGLEPLMIQVSSIEEEDQAHIQAIVEKHNPYITREANMAGLTEAYRLLQPNTLIGAAFPATFEDLNMVSVFVRGPNDLNGFKLIELFMESLDKAHKEVCALEEKQ